MKWTSTVVRVGFIPRSRSAAWLCVILATCTICCSTCTARELPVDIILEFLNIDPEDAKQKLEDSLFTVNDSKFNELLSNLYGSIGEVIMQKSDLIKRVIKGMTLNEVDNEAEEVALRAQARACNLNDYPTGQSELVEGDCHW